MAENPNDDATEVVTEVTGLAALDVGTADRNAVENALRSLGRVRSWLDALEIRLARRAEEVSSFPEKIIADAARGDLRTGQRVVRRSETAAVAPAFADALAEGSVTAGHVDAYGRALQRLDPADRARLLDGTARLVRIAQHTTVEEFTRRLRCEVARLSHDDGEDRLARQKRATRLRTWVDPVDGMWCLYGRFDPETGQRIDAKIQTALAAIFADGTPDTCPSDPGEKQDHLRGLVIARLIEGQVTSAPGRCEGTVVVDVTSPSGPMVDWGLPVELPWRVLVDLFGVNDPTTVVVRNGVVLHAPGLLDLGRTTRLANRAQRRALRALYATCAVPGCPVRYDHTKLHHITWWDHGGPTDLANLIPLCEQHHHAVHDHHWQLHLSPNRQLTVTLPDGQVMTTGPPSRHAA